MQATRWTLLVLGLVVGLPAAAAKNHVDAPAPAVKDRVWLAGLKNGCASGLAVVCSKSLLQPFDTLKTLQQASGASEGLAAAATRLVSAHGFLALYRGLGISLFGAVPSMCASRPRTATLEAVHVPRARPARPRLRAPSHLSDPAPAPLTILLLGYDHFKVQRRSHTHVPTLSTNLPHRPLPVPPTAGLPTSPSTRPPRRSSSPTHRSPLRWCSSPSPPPSLTLSPLHCASRASCSSSGSRRASTLRCSRPSARSTQVAWPPGCLATRCAYIYIYIYIYIYVYMYIYIYI